MKEQWNNYSAKYLALSMREQYLVLLTGIVVFVMVIFTYFIEANLASIKKQNNDIVQITSGNRSTANSITMLQQALAKDPNIAIKQQIAQYESKLVKVDADLLKLTSDLIDPIQMRHALLELLNLQKGVKLVSFQVMPVEPILLTSDESLENNTRTKNKAKQSEGDNNIDDKLADTYQGEPVSLGLYRHSIKLKLKGKYFHLRDYLSQLEGLSWTFFWQKFHYQLLEYPKSELEIEIYSLSTKPEFIGV